MAKAMTERAAFRIHGMDCADEVALHQWADERCQSHRRLRLLAERRPPNRAGINGTRYLIADATNLCRPRSFTTRRPTLKIVILGGGFGGIVAAHSLRNELGNRHDVTVISQDAEFYLRAAFPRLAFEGETRREDIRLPLKEALTPRGIAFRQARVTAICPDRNVLETSAGDVEYDYLIIAFGARYAAERVPGLEAHSYSLWTVAEAERLRERLRAFDGGSFVTGAAPGSPCEGPTWEATLHLDHQLRQRGMRERAEIHLVTTKPNLLAPAGPEGVRWAKETFATLGVRTYTDAEIVELTADRVALRDGREIRFDASLIMAPYQGHDIVRQAGLADAAGFILVDAHTRSTAHRNIFAVGDAVSMPDKPKMAHNAMRGAKIAAANIALEIQGHAADLTLDYEMMCVVENGGGRGTYMKSTAPWGGDLSVRAGRAQRKAWALARGSTLYQEGVRRSLPGHSWQHSVHHVKAGHRLPVRTRHLDSGEYRRQPRRGGESRRSGERWNVHRGARQAAGSRARQDRHLDRRRSRSGRRSAVSRPLGRGTTAGDGSSRGQGRGVTASVEGKRYWLGSHRYLEEMGQQTPALQQQLNTMMSAGRTVVIMGTDDHVCGFITLADPVRPESVAAIKALREAGIEHIVMLTGDNKPTADRIGREVGIDGVRAESLPADKVAAVEALVRRYE